MANFWLFNWCFPFPLRNLVPLHLQSQLNLNTTVDQFICNGTQNLTYVQHLLDRETIDTILLVPLPVFEKADEFVWGGTGSGKFFIKSAVELHHANIQDHRYSKLLATMWKLRLSPKVKTFSWLLLIHRM